MSKHDLRDHAEELLSAVVTDMTSAQTGRQQTEKSKGHQELSVLGKVGQKHAVERLETGLKLDQLVSEYRALRASVLRLWDAKCDDEHQEMTRFNEAIDETLAESAHWYSEKMTQTRDQFLGILGHDLRNPLASILMGAATLSRPGIGEIKQLGVAARITHSAERMNRMVNDLLDLTRTRLGPGIPITPKPLSLNAVVEHVIGEMTATHPERVFLFTHKEELRGEWDGDRIHQVIANLVGNALQHGDDDTPVTITARARGDTVEVLVHNHGPPIAAKSLKSIFEPMMRLPSEQHAQTTGLGLGLFIVREIVTAHAGRVTVTSTEEAGTTFTVSLPLHVLAKRSKRRAKEQQPKANAKKANAKKANAKKANEKKANEKKANASRGGPARPRVKLHVRTNQRN